MIGSMFNLQDRLAELRPTETEERQARERRDAAFRSAATRPGDAAHRPHRVARASVRSVAQVPTRVAAR